MPAEAVRIPRGQYIDRGTLASVAGDAGGFDHPFRAILNPDIIAETTAGIEMPGDDGSQLGIPADDLDARERRLVVLDGGVGVLEEVLLRHPFALDSRSLRPRPAGAHSPVSQSSSFKQSSFDFGTYGSSDRPSFFHAPPRLTCVTYSVRPFRLRRPAA